MPLLKGCSRCGTTMFLPTMRDGKCFCSPECETLYHDPKILERIAAEAPSVVRTRAAVLLAITLAISGYLICFPPAFAGRRWLFGSAFLIPGYFLVELLTGRSFQHASLWYQALPEWKRALIVLAIMILAFGGLAGAVYLYLKLNPNF